MFSSQKWDEMLNKHFSRRFQLKETIFSLLFALVPRGYSRVLREFQILPRPVHAQLNRNATSILREMQSKHRDQEPNERHAQERKGCGQRRMPQLRNIRLPNRKGLAAHLKPRAPLQYFSTLNPPLVEPFNLKRGLSHERTVSTL